MAPLRHHNTHKTLDVSHALNRDLPFPAGGHNGMGKQRLAKDALMQTGTRFSATGMAAPVRPFRANEFIYREGDPAGRVLRLVTGVVRCSTLQEDGRRFIDAFHLAGDLFGMAGDGRHASSAEAICACSVQAFPAEARGLRAPLAEAVAWQMITALTAGLHQAALHARLVAQASAIGKTSAFLIDWAGRTGSFPLVTLPMTRQDIADHLGLSMETLCRCLAQLKRDGLIEMLSVRRFRLLDAPALRQMAA